MMGWGVQDREERARRRRRRRRRVWKSFRIEKTLARVGQPFFSFFLSFYSSGSAYQLSFYKNEKRKTLQQAYEGLRTADRLVEQYALVPAKVKDVYAVYILHGVGGGEARSSKNPTSTSSSAVLPPSLFSPSDSSPSSSADPPPPRSALVFCATTQGCASLARLLAHLSVPAAALHSALPQRERLAALDAFRGGRVPLLLATDVASRGLDIPTVDLVLNYDVPADPADYVHRVGRTARAGRAGRGLTLVTQHDIARLQRVEAALGGAARRRDGADDDEEGGGPRQLADAALEERDVLKWITRVYSARKAAALEAADEAARGDARGMARGGGGGGGEKKRRRHE